MSGLPYTGGMNSYMFDMSQYGVNMPQMDRTGEYLQGASSAASVIPYVGPILSSFMNIAGTYMQNQQQEYFYNQYMSPQARMRQMVAAGINPNAAAQGIAGAAAPNLTAAAPTSAFSPLGEQLGQSANTALTANVLRTEAQKNQSEANLNDSLNVEKTITNSYLDKQQQATLDKLIADGKISQSTANMLAVDEYYKPATAEASYQQLVMNLGKTCSEINNLIAKTEQAYADAYAAMMAGNLSEAQIHKVFSDIGLNSAMIKKIGYECDVLEAQEASIYQDITESKARVIAQNIQNQFQQDYYDIWNNTGFNWNSDTEKSIVGSYANMDIDNADRMVRGLKLYITEQGNARSQGKDFVFDNLVDIYGHLVKLGLGAGISSAGQSIGTGISKSPGFVPKSAPRYPDGRRSILPLGRSAAPKPAGSRSYGRGR